MAFSYAISDKVLFYLQYFYRKVFCVWFEVRRPKLRMFLYEMLYSAGKLLDPKSLYPSPFGVTEVETVFGKFRIRPRSLDMSNVSPAYERPDVDRTLGLLHELAGAGKKAAFLDVGADIGTFAIAVGNRMKDYGGLTVMAFEPAESSFKILGENVRLNRLEGMSELYNFPLYSQDGLELEFSFSALRPGTSGLRTDGGQGTRKVVARTLDAVLGERVSEFDAFVLKLDVEGAERDVLMGARGVLGSGAEVYLLVEDFVEPAIVGYLEDIGAKFMQKLTPYNSFWFMQ